VIIFLTDESAVGPEPSCQTAQDGDTVGNASLKEHEVSHNGGNVSKSSRRAEAPLDEAAPAAVDFVHSAADRVGPMVHTAADRVGPLAQSAATRVGPLADAAADRIGAAADKVSPLAHTAADRLGPLAQSAAERVGPITHDAAERLAPLAHSAADRIAPLANQAVERVSPYAQQAVGKVSPYAQQAVERIGPIATSAKQQSARAAYGAVERIAPVLDEALERVSPAVEAARGKVAGELVPKLAEALSAAAAVPVAAEATQRGKAGSAAANGELELPKEKKKGRWLMRIAIVAAIAGAAVFVVRRVLGGRDADWQAARPTTPYAPPRPAGAAGTGQSTAAPVVDGAVAEAGDDDQGGLSAHLLNLEADGAAVPDQPAEGGVVETPAEAVAAVEEALDEAVPVNEESPIETTSDSEVTESPPADEATGEAAPADDAAAATEGAASEAETRRYQGEGVYVGHEPPEGFTIKGNERSMKYHVPESGGYGRTVAEVWFNSEEAAKQAGFVRAQR
jgi:hypothetical protein